MVNLDTLALDLAMENPGRALAPDSLADITCTSGSTGGPKGTLQQHRTLLHDSMKAGNFFCLSTADRVMLATFWNTGQGRNTMYRTVLNGATLCPWPAKQDGIAGLADWLRQEAITILALATTSGVTWRRLRPYSARPERQSYGWDYGQWLRG